MMTYKNTDKRMLCLRCICNSATAETHARSSRMQRSPYLSLFIGCSNNIPQLRLREQQVAKATGWARKPGADSLHE